MKERVEFSVLLTRIRRVYRYGKRQDDKEDISDLWSDDLVTFYLGCSFSFESALLRRGIPIRNIEV